MIKTIDNLKELLKLNNTAPNWSKMLLASLTITFPLIIGLARQEMRDSVFGALFSLVFVLNDHEGILHQRIKHLFITFLFILGSITLGSIASINSNILFLIIFIFTILLGKIKKRGIELERLILFCLLYIMTIADSQLHTTQMFLPVIYSIISYFFYTIILLILNLFTKHKNLLKSKREIFIKSWRNTSVNKFSIYFSFVTVLSYIILKNYHINRSYWIVGTILIVMSHEKASVIKKSLQRIVGTVLGVLTSTILIYFFPSPPELIILVSIFALFFPYAMNKNYWLGNLFIASLIMFFLSLSIPNSEVTELYFTRCFDIIIGGLISIAAISLFNYLETFSFLNKKG